MTPSSSLAIDRVLLGDLDEVPGVGGRILKVPANPLDAAHVAPDRRRPELVVAEAVVEVVVGIDHRGDRLVRDPAQLGQDLAGMADRAPSVDDHRAVVGQDRPDLLVHEAIAAGEDPLANLKPMTAAGAHQVHLLRTGRPGGPAGWHPSAR